MLLPNHQCAAVACLKNLLCRPERVFGCLRAQQHELINGQPEVRKRERIGDVRRLNERNRALPQCGERRFQQTKLAYARLLHQQVHERAHRPAATRQLGR